MRVNALTDVGRVRSENQDNYRVGVMPDNSAWGIVCDGMGGGYDGSLASTIAVDAIEKAFTDKISAELPEDDVKDLMLEAIKDANTQVYEKSGKGQRVMGTTVVCAVLQKDILHLAHAGDSRAYLYHGGKLETVTRDHSVVQELIEKGKITAEEAVYHPEKNVITRALGVDEKIEIDYKKIKIKEKSLILICTDGLTNMVQNERIVEFLADTDFYNMAKELVSQALVSGGADNITVVLMDNEEGGKNAG